MGRIVKNINHEYFRFCNGWFMIIKNLEFYDAILEPLKLKKSKTEKYIGYFIQVMYFLSNKPSKW